MASLDIARVNCQFSYNFWLLWKYLLLLLSLTYDGFNRNIGFLAKIRVLLPTAVPHRNVGVLLKSSPYYQGPCLTNILRIIHSDCFSWSLSPSLMTTFYPSLLTERPSNTPFVWKMNTAIRWRHSIEWKISIKDSLSSRRKCMNSSLTSCISWMGESLLIRASTGV